MITDPSQRQFLREVEQEIALLGRAVLEATSAVVGAVVRDLVERSPVLTGAYNASHAVLGSSGQLLYEGDERPGGDEIIRPGSREILAPADGDAAAVAVLAEAEPFERLEIWNGRFYASFLEYGTASMAPRSIYASAAEVGNAVAAEIASRGGARVQVAP